MNIPSRQNIDKMLDMLMECDFWVVSGSDSLGERYAQRMVGLVHVSHPCQEQTASILPMSGQDNSPELLAWIESGIANLL